MKRTILIIFMLALAVGGWYTYKMYQQKTPDVVNQKPDVTIDASDLLAAFGEDTAIARKQYINKIIEVSGLVKKADTSAIVLGDTDSESSIVCGIDRRHVDDYKRIKVGSTTTIQGNCVGYEKSEEMMGISLGTTVYLSYAGVKEKK
jgi:hypothetical protein